MNRILDVVRIMIEAGDTGANSEVLAKGTMPRNAFLAAFMASCGLRALLELIQSENALVDAMCELQQLCQLVVSIISCYTVESLPQQAQGSDDSSESNDDDSSDDSGADYEDSSDTGVEGDGSEYDEDDNEAD